MTKNFNDWNNFKIKLDSLDDSKIPFFNEGEVWWASVGLNVGYEVYGKDSAFARPLLILKKTSRYMFIGVPFTKYQKPNRPFWYPFPYKGEQGSLMIDQMCGFDGRRLLGKMGTISNKDLMQIKQTISGLL